MKKQTPSRNKKTPSIVAQASNNVPKKNPSFSRSAWNWISKQNYKLWFWVSLAVCSVLTLYWATKAGINGDGAIEYEYAQQCIDYYFSGGKDTTCINFKWQGTVSFPNEKYYGTGFEGTFVLLQRWINAEDVHIFRQLYLAMWSIVLLLFLALIAKELTGWKGALLALWITFLWPFMLGNFWWNSKDVPQTLGFAVAIYFFLKFLKFLPKISIKNLAGVALGIAIALSVRVGGALLAFYVGLFSVAACLLMPEARKLFVEKNYLQVIRITLAVVTAVVAGVCVGMLFYPNTFHAGFIDHLMSGVEVVTNFPQRIPFIFEGKTTSSLEKPWYYLIKMFYITTPMLILILLHIGILVVLWKWKKLGAINVFILLFSAVFPFAYMMYTNAPVYNAWRHVLFAVVTMPAMISIGVKELLVKAPAMLKIIALSLIVIPCVYLAQWDVRHTPYHLAFFNSTVGGTRGAYKNYDFDQLQIATCEGLDWLLDSVNPNEYSEQRPLVVAMNNPICTKTYLIPKKWRGKLNLTEIAFRGYAQTECDYAIFNQIFATPNVLSYFWPPKGTVYKRDVEGVTIMCVIDRRNDTDYRGIKALQYNEIEKGVKLLEEAYAYNPRNYTMYYWLGYGYYLAGNYARAIDFLNSYKSFYNEREVNRILGYAHYANKQYDEAIQCFNIAFAQDQNDMQVAYMIGLSLFEKQDYVQASTFLQQILSRNPTFTNGQNLLQTIQQMGR